MPIVHADVECKSALQAQPKWVEGSRAPLVAQCGGGPEPGKKRQVVCENLLPGGTGG